MNVLDTVMALRKTNSLNEKKEILKHAPIMFQELLQYTYDPFKRYHIQKLPWTGKGSETLNGSWPVIKSLLDELSYGFGGQKEKDLVQHTITAMNPSDAELFKCIIKKDLRAGISATTINSVYPGLIPVFGAMKAKKFEEKRWHPKLFVSVKLEGLRAQSINGKLYSMNGIPFNGFEHIELALSDNIDLDGELLIPGMHFQESSGKIRSHNSTPEACFFIYDIPSMPDQPFEIRYEGLKTLAKDYQMSDSILNPTTITLVKHTHVPSLEALHNQFQKVLAAGFEGLMLKDPQHTYKPGKRTYDWMKMKNILEEDVVITGFFEGQGKYEGQLGGVLVKRKNGKTCKVGGGFSDQERADIWNNQDKYIGRIIEVHYHEDTPDGDFRHARKKHWRPDKD